MSRMIEELQRQGIKLKRGYNPGNQKSTCPRCSHTRKNKTDECLSVTIDGDAAVWNCHHCFWKGSAGNVSARKTEPALKEYKQPAAPKAQPGAFPADAMAYIKARGITDEVIQRNKLYWDAGRRAICFPYFDGGKMINVKYRTLDKKFMLEGGAKLVLYGLDDIRNQQEIIIVEGEFDKLALEVCGIKNVVSVPNGAPARIKEGDDLDNRAFDYLKHSEAAIKAAKRVVIAVDDDPAGDNLRYELVRRIGAHKCWIVKFGVKDANDSLLKNGSDVTLDAMREAKPCPIKGLYQVNDFTGPLLDYFTTGMKSGVPTGFENLDRLFTLKGGETTVITGVPNNGKSEFAATLLINVAKNENWKSAIFSPEHKKEQLVTTLIEKLIGLPTSPKAANRMSQSQFVDGAAWVDRYFQFIIADDYEDMPDIDWVLDKATAAVYREGVKAFLIDPWNELQLPEPKRGVSETDHIGQNIAKVMRWGKRYDVANFIVAHPAKISSDKEGKTRVPVLYDIHGSAHWVNKPDNGIVVHISEDASSATDIYVRKVRDKHVGARGKCTLNFEKATGQYTVPKNAYSGKSFKDQDMETHESNW